MEPELTQPADENAAFQQAVAAFAAEEKPKEETPAPVTPPTPVVEGAVAETPAPETPPAQEAKKPDDFVEFSTPEQKERFNKVFGYAKRLEREIESLRQQRVAPPVYQPQPVTPQQPVVPQPSFTEAKPKLSQFEDADQWADAVLAWSERKAEAAAARVRDEWMTQQKQQEQQAASTREREYQDARIAEGMNKYGTTEFSSLAQEVGNFIGPGMKAYDVLFSLKRFPDVVAELGRNLELADRISRLHEYDQVHELKALERRLIAQEELRAKTPPKTPTKVEQPGTGLGPQAVPGFQKLKKEALESGGDMDAFAKVFMLESQGAR